MLVWVVFLILIISTAVKKGKRNTNQQNTTSRNYADTRNRPQTGPIPREKRQRSRASCQNNTNSAGTSQRRQMNMEDIYDENNIVAAAKANAREVERDNDLDASQDNLMEDVYDVMVKGPNDTISFQRDFLAEGLDMLNSFQIGKE